MSYVVTTIDLLRHGKPEGGEIFRGTTDVALLEEGWQQMQESLVGHSGWTKVVSSPMKRCVDFSRDFSRKRNLGLQQDERIREISFGDWDGVSYEEVKRLDKNGFDSFWQDPINFSPPNAEPMKEFSARVSEGFWNIVSDNQDEHVLLVTHGGVVRSIIADILKTQSIAMMRLEVPYACLTRIRVYHDQDNAWPQLVFHNP